MKKLILVFAAIAMTAGVYSQTDTTGRKMSPREPINNQQQNINQQQNMQNNTDGTSRHADGILMQNGKMMRVQNGKMTILEDNDLTLSNGTRIMRDGSYTQKDGTRLMIKEGEHMDMSGKLININTDKDRNMYLVPDSLKNRKF